MESNSPRAPRTRGQINIVSPTSELPHSPRISAFERKARTAGQRIVVEAFLVGARDRGWVIAEETHGGRLRPLLLTRDEILDLHFGIEQEAAERECIWKRRLTRGGGR